MLNSCLYSGSVSVQDWPPSGMPNIQATQWARRSPRSRPRYYKKLNERRRVQDCGFFIYLFF